MNIMRLAMHRKPALGFPIARKDNQDERRNRPARTLPSPRPPKRGSNIRDLDFSRQRAALFRRYDLVLCGLSLRQPAGFLAAARETNVTFGTVNTLVLVTSSFAMAVAAQAGDARARHLSLLSHAATIFLGFVFLIVKGFEYREDILTSFPALISRSAHQVHSSSSRFIG
jgi:hypothetical protein